MQDYTLKAVLDGMFNMMCDGWITLDDYINMGEQLAHEQCWD